MPKLQLFILALTVIIITAIATIIFSKPQDKLSKTEIETATNQANMLYRQRKMLGESFILGPCLSNALMDDWVVDIVHNPRMPIDDLPENQCPSFREGRAKHAIELDLEGRVVGVK